MDVGTVAIIIYALSDLSSTQLARARPMAVLYPALWTGEHFYERVCLGAITAIVNTGSAYLK
jgi:hypothetical protein